MDVLEFITQSLQPNYGLVPERNLGVARPQGAAVEAEAVETCG